MISSFLSEESKNRIREKRSNNFGKGVGSGEQSPVVKFSPRFPLPELFCQATLEVLSSETFDACLVPDLCWVLGFLGEGVRGGFLSLTFLGHGESESRPGNGR